MKVALLYHEDMVRCSISGPKNTNGTACCSHWDVWFFHGAKGHIPGTALFFFSVKIGTGLGRE